jgi:hypothetical protein
MNLFENVHLEDQGDERIKLRWILQSQVVKIGGELTGKRSYLIAGFSGVKPLGWQQQCNVMQPMFLPVAPALSSRLLSVNILK